MIPATLKIKNPLKAGRNTKGKSDGGSRNGPKVEGYGGLLRCGNNAPDGLDYEPVIRSGHCLAGQ
ncbi:hypothetical protein ACRCL5_28725, partial [Klebsiella pneumoniae]|uniref:hypothetical protein n=1 Tax=Klebsiella pneumoniae TaxID=573 RepID=UPI003D9809A0